MHWKLRQKYIGRRAVKWIGDGSRLETGRYHSQRADTKIKRAMTPPLLAQKAAMNLVNYRGGFIATIDARDALRAELGWDPLEDENQP